MTEYRTDPTAAPQADYASYPSLVDRNVLITGGADGIGAGLVTEFAKQGSRVAFLDLQADRGEALVGELADSRHAPVFRHIDLTDIEATQSAIRELDADFGGFAALVNNAASDDRHTWQEMTADYWDDRLNTNLRHYFFTIQAVAPGMLERGVGSIVNVGSSSYMMQEDFFPGYAIAKSGVEGITRTLSLIHI